jgi:2-octaprenyl-6-methoxyphenol hydroxylase
MIESTEILIVGGGLVGASLAIALDVAGIAATLIESAPPRADAHPGYDERNLALARASVNGLTALGVWPLAAHESAPIRRVHVSRAGVFGATRLDAVELGLDSFGHTLPARALGAALLARLDACTRLTRLTPATVTGLEHDAGGWRARLVLADGERMLRTRLLVGADGTSSRVRMALGIAATTLDYAQTLFVCTLTPQRSLAGCAYERFGDDGPTALLPLPQGRAGLVLSVPATAAAAVGTLDDGSYLALAQARFGARVGRLSRPGRRHAYAIQGVLAQSLTAPRAVLIGNAAQTLHPVGAQGFNLGLRDALTLAEHVAGAVDPGAASLLAAYAAQRATDRDGTAHASHGLVRVGGLVEPALRPLASLALLTADALPPLRRAIAHRGMGFRGQPPRAVLEPGP